MRRYHTCPPLTAPIWAVCVVRCMRTYCRRIQLRSELYAYTEIYKIHMDVIHLWRTELYAYLHVPQSLTVISLALFYLSIVRILVTILFTFMRSNDHFKVVFLEKCCCHIRSKIASSASKRVWKTAWVGFWVTPQQIEHL